jgi:WD40 repeat protein
METPCITAINQLTRSFQIDIFHLPSQRRLHTVKLGEQNGMVMALSLFYRSDTLVLVAGYENGLALVAELNSEDTWVVSYRGKAHSQPILSLDVSVDRDYFFTSSADAMIIKHPIPPRAGPQSSSSGGTQAKPTSGTSLLSAALASQPARAAPPPSRDIETEPLKVANTKHSGQQSLRIRSDSRIFATAGWDSKIRVYSVKTMKEVAVLKWHQVGCYAVAFSTFAHDGDEKGGSVQGEPPTSQAVTTIPKLGDVTVRDRRIRQAKTAHWLAAGSKDGKVSLWDVF